jgi:hypothetical protein
MGAIYCIECCPVDTDSEDVAPVFASEEVDSYPVCDTCGTQHDYMGLTLDGLREVARRAHLAHECERGSCPDCKDAHTKGHCSNISSESDPCPYCEDEKESV